MDRDAAFTPTAAQRTTLGVLLDRLIPADDNAPGGLAVIGIDGLVTALNTPRYAPVAAGLSDWLDALAPAISPAAPASVEATLQAIEQGHVPAIPAAPFAHLLTITAELYYGSPADLAANRTTVAWQALGYHPRPASPSPHD